MDNQWMDRLRKRAEKHTEPAPKNLWENIEQRMVNIDIEKVVNSPTRVIPIWRRHLRIATSVAAAILLSVLGTFFILNQSIESIQIVSLTSSDLLSDRLQNYSNQAINFQEIEKGNKLLDNVGTIDSKIAYENQNSQQKTEEDSLQIEEVVSKLDIEDSKLIEDSYNVKDEHVKKTGQVYEKVALDEKEHEAEIALFKNKKVEGKQTNRWDAQLYASNTPTSANNGYQGYGAMNVGRIASADYGLWKDGIKADILTYNEEKYTYTDIKHKQPITVGVSFNYYLSKRWSMELGATYALLSSELKSGSESYYFNNNQTLHYLGFTNSLNYTIWNSRYLTCYASGGWQVQKLVSGRLKTDYIVNNNVKSTDRESVSEARLLWGIHASAGLQLNISKVVGLYTEPSINYMFNNHTDIETIYKDRPFNFGIKIGFRFSFY